MPGYPFPSWDEVSPLTWLRREREGLYAALAIGRLVPDKLIFLAPDASDWVCGVTFMVGRGLN